MEISKELMELKMNLSAFSIAVNQWIGELESQIDALSGEKSELVLPANVKLFPVNGRRQKLTRPEQPAA